MSKSRSRSAIVNSQAMDGSARVLVVVSLLLFSACSLQVCGVGIHRHEVVGEPSPAQLVTALGSEDVETRAMAARTLGILGPKASEAVPALKKALNDPDAKVRSEAANALKRIEPSGN